MSPPDSPGDRPRTSSRPAARGRTPRTALISVDLPDPLGPRTATNVPGPMTRSTWDQMSRPPSRTAASAKDTAGAGGDGVAGSAMRTLQCRIEGVELCGLPGLEARTGRHERLGDGHPGDPGGAGRRHLGLHVGGEVLGVHEVDGDGPGPDLAVDGRRVARRPVS